ncbi:MAG: hypothetical protein PHH09_08465 [Methanoregulaceae archaeon]|nr:hypothetical protein [Methanoregulaceae archaeon]
MDEKPRCPDGHEMIEDYPNSRIRYICPICGHMEPTVEEDDGE